MKYKVNDVKRILNLSKDTLRYFDNKRLISSMRDENNYRYFKCEDINKIFAYKMYRSLLFNMKDAEKLVSGDSVETQKTMLKNQLQFIESEQDYLNRAKKHIEMLAEKLEKWGRSKDGFEIVTSHNCYYHCNQTDEHFIKSEEVFTNTYKFLNHMPDLWPAFSYNIDCKETPYRFSYGYASYATESHPVEELLHLPAVRSLYKLFTIEDNLKEKVHDIMKEAENFCNKKSYNIKGKAYGNMLHEMIEDTGPSRLFDIYIPIE
ncbi:putative transcriptional regulator, MerR family [Alkaliphilus metalliredigens QYMF]|uniref:Putative transcriptional regulator, MerR family n=1 Tax=Alkaliphilus metalliredigens (strain QYMF) TaxID=293826 RepID=A6TN27_ALKMQ|nr:MerR family transcriptional regulator [Alkaliphilus metalliredigens]ABR47595.1 putative transcriptional regulator, MerR family [Alkaliphilus metalliredigens QYMF]